MLCFIWGHLSIFFGKHSLERSYAFKFMNTCFQTMEHSQFRRYNTAQKIPSLNKTKYEQRKGLLGNQTLSLRYSLKTSFLGLRKKTRIFFSEEIMVHSIKQGSNGLSWMATLVAMGKHERMYINNGKGRLRYLLDNRQQILLNLLRWLVQSTLMISKGTCLHHKNELNSYSPKGHWKVPESTILCHS